MGIFLLLGAAGLIAGALYKKSKDASEVDAWEKEIGDKLSFTLGCADAQRMLYHGDAPECPPLAEYHPDAYLRGVDAVVHHPDATVGGWGDLVKAAANPVAYGTQLLVDKLAPDSLKDAIEDAIPEQVATYIPGLTTSEKAALLVNPIAAFTDPDMRKKIDWDAVKADAQAAAPIAAMMFPAAAPFIGGGLMVVSLAQKGDTAAIAKLAAAQALARTNDPRAAQIRIALDRIRDIPPEQRPAALLNLAKEGDPEAIRKVQEIKRAASKSPEAREFYLEMVQAKELGV